MKIKYVYIVPILLALTACSSSEDTAEIDKPVASVKKDTVLKGYADALDKAKAVKLLANESTLRKQELMDNK